MKFIPFAEHTHKVPGDPGEEIEFFKEGNAVIFCLQLSRDEIIKLKDRGGKIWVRSFTPLPPPIQLTLNHPFRPLPTNEKNNPQGPGDNQQSNESDNKLSPG